ncbi:MAG: DUF1993 family protein [Rubricella sp.]
MIERDDDAFYEASVPVLAHYLVRIGAILDAVPNDAPLGARLAPGMFTGAEQFAVAQGFALRAIFPLLGRAVPDLPEGEGGRVDLMARNTAALAIVSGLDRDDFEGAAGRVVRHEAGFAMLEQRAWEYLTRYALPNFFFHYSMGYAVLRSAGMPLGKADFDGLHSYPPGFRFED